MFIKLHWIIKFELQVDWSIFRHFLQLPRIQQNVDNIFLYFQIVYFLLHQLMCSLLDLLCPTNGFKLKLPVKLKITKIINKTGFDFQPKIIFYNWKFHHCILTVYFGFTGIALSCSTKCEVKHTVSISIHRILVSLSNDISIEKSQRN